jgi:membrane protease YdiL (CAAX protease family)
MSQTSSSGESQIRDEYPLGRLVFLHLAPGAVFTASVILASSLGMDPAIALFGGIGVVLVPIELGYLSLYSRRATGSWSPMGAVGYRERPPARRLALLTAALTGWFLLSLIVSIAVLDTWLSENLFSWMPDSLLQFASPGDDEESLTNVELAAFVILALLFNGLAGPITEELYFRGHLLPRMERYGAWAAPINTGLFALYHFFSPWRYPAIVIGFLPISWMAWRERSIYVSMAAHITINMITVLLLAAAFLADG